MSDSAQFTPPNPHSLGANSRWWTSRDGDPAKKEKELTTEDIPEGGFWDPNVAMLPLRHAGRANVLFCDGHVISIGRIGELREKNLYWNY